MPRVAKTSRHTEALVCNVCDSTFSRKAERDRHMKLHAPDIDRLKSACPYEGCPYRTLQKYNIKTHITAVHLKERPHKCRDPDCGQTFSDGAALNRHEKKHGYFRNGKSRTGDVSPHCGRNVDKKRVEPETSFGPAAPSESAGRSDRRSSPSSSHYSVRSPSASHTSSAYSPSVSSPPSCTTPVDDEFPSLFHPSQRLGCKSDDSPQMPSGLFPLFDYGLSHHVFPSFLQGCSAPIFPAEEIAGFAHPVIDAADYPIASTTFRTGEDPLWFTPFGQAAPLIFSSLPYEPLSGNAASLPSPDYPMFDWDMPQLANPCTEPSSALFAPSSLKSDTDVSGPLGFQFDIDRALQEALAQVDYH